MDRKRTMIRRARSHRIQVLTILAADADQIIGTKPLFSLYRNLPDPKGEISRQAFIFARRAWRIQQDLEAEISTNANLH